MQNICTVVVTYNRLEMLRQCISALEKQTVACEILVVDNASTDGTAAWLAQKQNVINIRMPKNTGGAGGFNKGMREAVIRGFDYIWVMDDDTIPDPNALEEVLNADKLLGGHYGWLSAVPLWTDGKVCIINKQKVYNSYFEDIQLLKHGLLRAVHATFVGLFLRRETILKAGLPIKEFFIWGDDIEYTRRLSVRMKMPCYVVGQSQVTHAMKDNSGGNIAVDVPERLPRYNLAFRNENYLFRQEGLKGFFYYFAKCGKYILLALFKSKNHRFKRVWIIIKQFFAGLFFNPPIEYIDANALNQKIPGRM